MPYKPTGRPAGRPRKDAVILPDDDDGLEDEEPIGTALNLAPGLGGLCKTCYADGWPDGATGLGCRHGSWTRLQTGIITQ